METGRELGHPARLNVGDGPSEQIGAKAAPLYVARTRDDAEQLIESVFIPHRLRATDPELVDLRLRYAATPRLTLARVAYRSGVELTCPPMGSFVHINLTAAGRTTARQAGRTVLTEARGAASIFNAQDEYVVAWAPGTTGLALRIASDALQEHLALLVGRALGPVEFHIEIDAQTDVGLAFAAAAEHSYVQLIRLGSGASRLMVDQLEAYLFTQLLLAARHDRTDELHAPPPTAGRRYVRAARQILEERPELPWTTVRLAEELHISERAIQAGFRAEVGQSPMEYLRAVRLGRVRRELLSRRQDKSISELASEWGFHHLGRFSSLYREAFGELPSETLRIRD